MRPVNHVRWLLRFLYLDSLALQALLIGRRDLHPPEAGSPGLKPSLPDSGLGWCPSLKPAVAPQGPLHTLSLIFISAGSFPCSQPCRQAGSLPRLALCHPHPIPTCHLGPCPSLIIPDEYGFFPSSLSVAKFAELLPASGPLHLLAISLACASCICPPGLLSHSLLSVFQLPT